MVEDKRFFLNQIKVLKVFCSFIFLLSFSIQGQVFKKQILDNNQSIDFNFTISEYNTSLDKYVDVIKNKKINPKESAIVLIDVWDDEFLNQAVTNVINPLIEELSKFGFKVIYSPSGGIQNKKLNVIDDGVIFYNLDVMDSYIKQNRIKNLFYVGFDALYCVMDKPNGVLAYKQRDIYNEMNYFVFDQGVTSFRKEMKDVALLMFKKNNIGVVSVNKKNMKEEVFPFEIDINHNLNTVLNPRTGKNAVILFKKNTDDKTMNDFEANLKKSKIVVFSVIDEELHYFDERIDTDYNFFNKLINLGIKNLFYAGYHLNNEMIWSKYGMANLYMHKVYYEMKEKLPKTYVVKDMSFVVDSENYDSSKEKIILLNYYRGVQNIPSKYLLKNLK